MTIMIALCLSAINMAGSLQQQTYEYDDHNLLERFNNDLDVEKS